MNSSTPTVENALSLHRQGNLADAETQYRLILAEYPDTPAALHGLGVLALQSGDPTAALALFERTLQLEPEWNDAISNRGLALSRLGRLEEALSDLHEVSRREPSSISALVNLADTLALDDQHSPAEKAYRRALQLDPGAAQALVNLGNLLNEAGQNTEAISLYRAALEKMPGNPQILSSLGGALVQGGRPEDAISVLEAAVNQHEKFAPAHFNLAMALGDTGDASGAERYLREAIVLDPAFARAHHNLAHTLLLQGKLTEGWEEYQWRWKAKVDDAMPVDYPMPAWDGSSLQDKSIVVWGEQGLGDKLLFYAHLQRLVDQGGTVILETEPRLAPLMGRSFPTIEIAERAAGTKPSAAIFGADYHVPSGDLVRWAWPTLDEVAPMPGYLQADSGLIQELRRRYGAGNKGPLIGISWASRPPKGILLEQLLAGLKLDSAVLVSLQYGDHAQEIAEVSRRTGIDVISDETIDPIADVDGSAAQIAAMDAVVTIQNATLYMGGALGVPTFALASPIPDWRWFGCDQSPWHQSVRLYTSERGTSFDLALAHIRNDLVAHIGL